MHPIPAMRLLVSLIAATAFLTPPARAVAAPREGIDYQLGGIMSGPYRVLVDLGAGTVSRSPVPGPGTARDTRTADLPMGPPVRLPAASLARLKALRDAVWRAGLRPKGLCTEITADAIAAVTLWRDGQARDETVSPPCAGPEGAALIEAVLCAAEPNQPTCASP